MRWHQWLGREDDGLTFCGPAHVVGGAVIVVPTVFPPATIVTDGGALVEVNVAEAPVVSFDLDDGAVTLRELLPQTDGGAVVRTLDGTDVVLRLDPTGVSVDFRTNPPTSVRFENMDYASTVIGFSMAPLERDVLITNTLSGLEPIAVPWDDGTQTALPALSGVQNAFIARVGPDGTRWALHGEGSESGLRVDASGLAFGHVANGALVDQRSGTSVATFPDLTSKGVVLDFAADGAIARTRVIDTLPISLACDDETTWVLGETLPVPGRHVLHQFSFVDAIATRDVSDVVLATRRGAVASIGGIPILGVTLATPDDVGALVARVTTEATVIIARPDP